MSKFKGIAYWEVKSSDVNWSAKAAGVLMPPLESKGLAVVRFDETTAGDQITVTMGEDNHELLIKDGVGRGVVRSSATAGMFVVCLMALRKALGGIQIVDDNQVDVPTLPRQNNALFAGCWLAIQPVVDALALVPSTPEFAAARRRCF